MSLGIPEIHCRGWIDTNPIDEFALYPDTSPDASDIDSDTDESDESSDDTAMTNTPDVDTSDNSDDTAPPSKRDNSNNTAPPSKRRRLR